MESIENEVNMKNPKWHRDEIILALDLYFQEDRGSIDARNPKVKELSEILNKLPIHTTIPDSIKFRNPNGVSLKLSNFLAIDPNYSGKGMSAYSKADYSIFMEFINNKKELAKIASIIKNIVQNTSLNVEIYKIEDEETECNFEAKEGLTIYKLHKYKERNRNIVKKKKETYLKKHGILNCEICGFNFVSVYGNLGKDFIECHHIKELANLETETITKLEDLLLVCPNCHKMLHRRLGSITVEELKSIIENHKILS